jgi:hypothetical protein
VLQQPLDMPGGPFGSQTWLEALAFQRLLRNTQAALELSNEPDPTIRVTWT